jgi:hypothetical protein
VGTLRGPSGEAFGGKENGRPCLVKLEPCGLL